MDFTRDIRYFCFRKKSLKYYKTGCNSKSFKTQDHTQPIQFAFNATEIITSDNENILTLTIIHTEHGSWADIILQFENIRFTSTPDFDRRHYLITIPGKRISKGVKHLLIFEVFDWNKNFTSHMITGLVHISLSPHIRDIYSFYADLFVNESSVSIKHKVCFQAL